LPIALRGSLSVISIAASRWVLPSWLLAYASDSLAVG
jgi:hypothetical protein